MATLILLLAASFGFSAKQTNDSEDRRPETMKGAVTKVYRTVDDHPLRVHWYRPNQWQPDDRRAAMILIHGGGWVNGTPAQFKTMARYFAARGMTTFLPEYRVGEIHGTTPFDAIEDIKALVRWVRSGYQQLGVDPTRIILVGGSAGGHLAAATAFLPAINASDDDLSISTRPAALILYNPALDATQYPEAFGDDARRGSPLHHVEPGAPPTLIFHGTRDRIVPINQSRVLQRLMKKNGDNCELVEFEGMTHGFFNEYRNDGAPFQKTIVHADRFLVEQGLLKAFASQVDKENASAKDNPQDGSD